MIERKKEFECAIEGYIPSNCESKKWTKISNIIESIERTYPNKNEKELRDDIMLLEKILDQLNEVKLEKSSKANKIRLLKDELNRLIKIKFKKMYQ